MLCVACVQLFSCQCSANIEIELWLGFAHEKKQLLHQLFVVHTGWLATIQLIMH